MSRDLSTVDPDKISDITQSSYYKKLQQDLKEKSSAHDAQKRRTKDEEATDSSKVEKVASAVKIQPHSIFEDKVTVRSFSWKQDPDREPELQSDAKPQPVSGIDLKNDGVHVLRVLGVKIDFTDKMTMLRQQFMQLVVQARSHNVLLSKFSAFKLGMLNQLLSVLGLSPQELSAMKKKAIEAAVLENIQLMSDNIYTVELTELLYGNTRKSRRTLAMLREVEAQLMRQMKALDKSDYWSPARLTEERIKQCKRIRDEFQKERDELRYQLDFYRMEF